jgi:autotransporter-like protein/autochaperone domain-containing protein
VGRRFRKGAQPGRVARRAERSRQASKPSYVATPKPQSIDRRGLLAGTALVSTLFIGTLLAPTPASAQQAVSILLSPNPVTVDNANDCIFDGNCIEITTNGDGAFIDLTNSGNLTAGLFGILTATAGPNSPISIVNTGIISASNLSTYTDGITAFTSGGNSPIAIDNSGDISARGQGIYAVASGYGSDSSPVTINNSARIKSGNESIYGITTTPNSPILIINSGKLNSIYAEVIDSVSIGANSPITIINSGDGQAYAQGLEAGTNGPNSPITIENSGDVSSRDETFNAYSSGAGSGLLLINSGELESPVTGIFSRTSGAGSDIVIVNYGSVTSKSRTYTINGYYGPFTIVTPGFGINASTYGTSSSITIVNAGTVNATVGIVATTRGLDSDITIVNAGTVRGDNVGIQTYTKYGTTTVINSGDISADSNLAIDVDGGAATILNAGMITGFVDLTDNDDLFINQKGGVWVTKLTSYFGNGSDIVRNLVGGTVQAATDPSVIEYSSFVGLERFENKGLISLQDGQVGDTFRITNSFVTPYGATIYGGAPPIVFKGSGQSALAIDAFLGGPGPGSTADNFIIDGDVSGQTKVKVNNTNTGPGVFNKEGIPVVFVNGATPKGDEFFLGNPIDTGFFNYDLFFRPTGSGVFELRSFLGQGAFVLPQLITSSQDIWHQTSDTWFDRTADLRVLLNGRAAPTAYVEGAPQGSSNITPAVWARGSGNWLDRQDSENVTAYGRDYRYNLNRDLETIDFQSGIDLGKRGLLSENDILVFGALGGFVHSDLDYDAINRRFSFEGGQVGGYATYLRGGLFVDTLVNVHLMEIDTGRSLGFPSSLDATTVGVRTDSGYRFGSFNGGAFIEPLATIAVDWADIDGFSLGGNKVSFDDDANVRGRLGLRVGTAMQVWTGTTMEPFVIGSLWGNLSGDDNQATLVSTGTTFILKDDLDDVWGEVSAGVNFFNPSANTSVFAKLDVTFGDDIDGVGGKAGMRVSW